MTVLCRLTLLLALHVAGLTCSGVGSYVYLGDNSKLYFVDNNEVYSPDKKQLLYFQKGNIFFSGESDDRQNIVLLTTGSDVTSNKMQSVFEKDARTASYSFSASKFYLGTPEEEDVRDRNELIHIERTGKWTSFYSSINDSLLGYYLTDSVSPSMAIITAYTLIKRYSLEKKVVEKQKKLPFPDNPSGDGSNKQQMQYVSLKPIWGNITANEWIWDGQVLRPRWNVDPRVAWTFDGRIVKPLYGNNIYEQYEWDGDLFKPVWRTNRAQEWSWDGKMLKPAWDSSDWSNQYIIEDGVVKPWSNVHPEKEWRMDGPIPVPLIIIVVSGIARPQ